MDIDHVRALLRDHIKHRYESQAEAGRVWSVSTAFVNMVLNGKKLPTKPMLEELGLERVITYRRKNKS
jgi:hypothetical protein